MTEAAAILVAKERLDAPRPLDPARGRALEAWHDVEPTSSSNPLEGNALTRSETAVIVEKGLTVGGKPLKDHLEAIDHRDALAFVRALAAAEEPIREDDIREIHRPVLGRGAPEEAGRYSRHARAIPGSLAAEGREARHPIVVPTHTAHAPMVRPRFGPIVPSALVPATHPRKDPPVTKTRIVCIAVSASALALTLVAAPANAVAIRKTNWAEGDPGVQNLPASRGTPPADTTPPKYFDRAHEDGRVTH